MTFYIKNPLLKAGFRKARRLGYKRMDERMHAVSMLIDLPASNGWIETYSRLFNVSGCHAQGEMSFHYKHCDDANPPAPEHMSLLTRAWFYLWHEIVVQTAFNFERSLMYPRWRVMALWNRAFGKPVEPTQAVMTPPCKDG